MEEAEKYGEDRNKLGRFVPGNKSGEKRGYNHVSTKVKESIVNFLEDNIHKVQKSFDKLEDKDKLAFIVAILPYAAPKLTSVQVQQDTEVSGGITISWQDPNP